jgi:hypothetical protein
MAYGYQMAPKDDRLVAHTESTVEMLTGGISGAGAIVNAFPSRRSPSPCTSLNYLIGLVHSAVPPGVVSWGRVPSIRPKMQGYDQGIARCTIRDCQE